MGNGIDALTQREPLAPRSGQRSRTAGLSRVLAVFLPLVTSSAPLLGACNETAECTTGTERCACYGNGTCEDGLVCLSAHCVDATSESDAALVSNDAALSPGDTDKSTAERADSVQPSPGGPTSEPAPSNSDGIALLTNGSESLDDPTLTLGAGSVSFSETSSASLSAPSSDAEALPTGTSAESVRTSGVVATDASSASEDTEPSEASIPELPARSASALDDAATTVAPSVTCGSGLNLNDICYEQADCVDSPCAATLQWVPATGTIAQTDYSLTLRDLSGDGTVVFGDWVAEGNSQRNALLLRWGNNRATLIDSTQTSGSAINFDATAALGALGNGDWTFVRWQRGGYTELPLGVGDAYDISYATTIIGYTRREDDVVYGFMWSSGQPTYAQTIALQAISGDGTHASGIVDGGGPVVLFYANGTKSIPTTPNLVPDGASDVNVDGSVVVGYGRDGSLQKNQMYRWRVGDEAVDVVPPLDDFDSAYPSTVTADGEIVVGANHRGINGVVEDSEAFYWDETAGMRAMVDELSQRGLEVPTNVWLSSALIAGDGTTVVGQGYVGSSQILWRARLAR